VSSRYLPLLCLRLLTDLLLSQSKLQKLKIAEEMNQLMMNKPINHTQLMMTERLVVDSYTAATKEWGSIIDTMNSSHVTRLVSHEQAMDGLAKWLDDVHLDSGEQVTPQEKITHPHISGNLVALYQCSYCMNPSAALRKCGGCGKTRYVTLQLCSPMLLTTFQVL
jgi:hypothetical protein